jgi:HD-GYP domain-containing protein (c-di-GMP phosphodiesterase class II)
MEMNGGGDVRLDASGTEDGDLADSADEGVVVADSWPGAITPGGDPVLNGETISDRLAALHDEMQQDPLLAGVGRVAAALYEPARDLVKTFIHATDGDNPLGSLAIPLSQTPALRRILREGRPRVFDDMEATPGAQGPVTRNLLRGGFRSRLVAPIIHQGTPFGVLFFNAHQQGYFSPEVLTALRPHMRAISMMLVHQRAMVRTMLAAVRTARAIGHHRDEETGEHLERMARYAQLIAEKLSKSHGLSDEFIEYLFQYAPLHDIGKVAVPDGILMKPGRLTPEEYAVMKSHVAKGVEIIELMQRDIGLTELPYAEILRNVVGGHHEALDGSGYPLGLRGGDISMEARICAVADVFDALVSRRPYKEPWSNEKAIDHLQSLAGKIFDPDCVQALADSVERVLEIQRQFVDAPPAPMSDDLDGLI